LSQNLSKMLFPSSVKKVLGVLQRINFPYFGFFKNHLTPLHHQANRLDIISALQRHMHDYIRAEIEMLVKSGKLQAWVICHNSVSEAHHESLQVDLKHPSIPSNIQADLKHLSFPSNRKEYHLNVLKITFHETVSLGVHKIINVVHKIAHETALIFHETIVHEPAILRVFLHDCLDLVILPIIYQPIHLQCHTENYGLILPNLTIILMKRE